MEPKEGLLRTSDFSHSGRRQVAPGLETGHLGRLGTYPWDLTCLWGDGIRTEVTCRTPSGCCGETITSTLELAAESLKAKESRLYFVVNWKSLKVWELEERKGYQDDFTMMINIYDSKALHNATLSNAEEGRCRAHQSGPVPVSLLLPTDSLKLEFHLLHSDDITRPVATEYLLHMHPYTRHLHKCYSTSIQNINLINQILRFLNDIRQ